MSEIGEDLGLANHFFLALGLRHEETSVKSANLGSAVRNPGSRCNDTFNASDLMFSDMITELKM